MKFQKSTIWLCLIPLLLSVSWLGSILHESDQASVAVGALRLVHGDVPWIGSDLYEYGNYFLSYWILAAVYKLFPSVDVLWLGNALCLLLFWGGAWFFLLSPRSESRSCGLAFFVALASPSILVHLPYFAPIFISAGFLFAGAGFFSRSSRNFPWALGCWAAAFSCRADAMLLVPLLAWVVAGEPRFSCLVRSSKSWSLVAVALVVALAGRLLSPGAEILHYKMFFHPEVYLAYLVFGAAGAAGLLLLLLWGLFRNGARSVDWDGRLFWWGAAVALLVPFAFYSFFMFTTRHWVLMISAQLLLIGSGRFELEGVGRKHLLPALAVLSVFLLFFGVRLPGVNQPQITLTRPELFPTTDGRCPMGAVLGFMYSEERLDHNHQTWLAAQAVSEWEEINGKVPLMPFPLFDIVRLSIFTRGQRTMTRGIDLSNSPFFYTSSRAILKPQILFDTKEHRSIGDELSLRGMQLCGGSLPIGILRVEANSEMNALRSSGKSQLHLFKQVFQGNEMRMLGRVRAGPLEVSPYMKGRQILLWAERAFSLETEGGTLDAALLDEESRRSLWFITFPIEMAEGSVLSHPVELATTVYPSYMNINRF